MVNNPNGGYMVSTIGSSEMFGIFSCLPVFSSGGTTGVMMSTGKVSEFSSAIPEFDFGTSGPTGDSAQLVISWTTGAAPTPVQFKFIFASSELPKYMGQTFNDAIEMRLTSTVDTAYSHNIAYMPDSCLNKVTGKCNNPEPSGACHVTINNLGMDSDQSNPKANWSPCYVSNPNGQYFAGYKGYTTEIQASSARYPLKANTPYTLNISVSDLGDGKFDSAVFLEANTLSLSSAPRRTDGAMSGTGLAAAPQVAEVIVAAPSGQHSTATLVAAVVGSVAATAAIALLVAVAVLRRRKGTLAAELPAPSHELREVRADHVGIRPVRSLILPRLATESSEPASQTTRGAAAAAAAAARIRASAGAFVHRDHVLKHQRYTRWSPG